MLGLNLNAKDLEIHFKDMDMDGQSSIDFDEFKRYVERNVFPYIGCYEEHMDEVKEMLEGLDTMGVGTLNVDEFKEAMARLKTGVNNDEIISLFGDIG